MTAERPEISPRGSDSASAASTAGTPEFLERRRLAMAQYAEAWEGVDVLVAAGIKKWVLMGLHGYVGYLALPRATQDVDVMVSYRERKRAVQAIRDAWPNLIVRELLQVVRFLDPGHPGPDGQPKAVIDLIQRKPPFGARGLQGSRASVRRPGAAGEDSEPARPGRSGDATPHPDARSRPGLQIRCHRVAAPGGRQTGI